MAGINLLKQARGLKRGESPTEDDGASQTPRESFLSRLSFSSQDSMWGREDSLRLFFFVIGVLLIPGSRMLIGDYTSRLENELQAQVSDLEQKVSAENKKLNDLKEIKKEADSYDARLADLQAKFKAVDDVSRNRNLVVRMVDFIVQEMPPNIWLSKVNVDVNQGKKIEIQGSALSLQLVGEFVKHLEGAVFFPTWNVVETLAETPSAQAANSTPKTLTVPVDSKKFSISAEVVKP